MMTMMTCPGPALTNYAYDAAISTLNSNSLRCRCCCKPVTHCNKSCDSIDLLKNLRLLRTLRPALQGLAKLTV